MFLNLYDFLLLALWTRLSQWLWSCVFRSCVVVSRSGYNSDVSWSSLFSLSSWVITFYIIIVSWSWWYRCSTMIQVKTAPIVIQTWVHSLLGWRSSISFHDLRLSFLWQVHHHLTSFEPLIEHLGTFLHFFPQIIPSLKFTHVFEWIGHIKTSIILIVELVIPIIDLSLVLVRFIVHYVWILFRTWCSDGQ